MNLTKKISTLAISALCLSCGPAPTIINTGEAVGDGDGTETLNISFETTSTYTAYAPRNVLAVWIEDSSGNHKQTLGRWANKEASSLKKWATKSGIDSDAVMGATRSSHTSFLETREWNIPSSLADGNYKICLEMTEAESGSPSNYTTIDFNKNGTSSVDYIATQDGFSSIKIKYTKTESDKKGPNGNM